MASVGATRKLYIDSRYKVSGTDVDFLIELPVDVDCSRTSSFFVASCSFANTFQTVTPDNNKFWFFMQQDNGAAYILYVATVTPGYYDPNSFAAALVAAVPNLRDNTGTVTWNPSTGTYTIDFKIEGQNRIQYMIPGYGPDVDYFVYLYNRPAQWTFDVLDLATNQTIPYTRGDKTPSINSLLNMPAQAHAHEFITCQKTPFETGIVDLAPLREVYLHSSLANHRTLHVNGARDCICRVPIDVPFGSVVQYRYLGPTDAISCSDAHFRTISFQLRDYSGKLVPTPFSFVVIELAFLDTDPYAL